MRALTRHMPVFLAEQGRDPHGWLGYLVAKIMSLETARDNDRAIELLELHADDRVLEIGSGHGRSLARIARQVTRGEVVGVDASELMVRIARRRNRRRIRHDQVSVIHGRSACLPFCDQKFDKILTAHTVYFWDPLAPHLSEIFRVLRPGGWLMLMCRPAEDEPGCGRFPDSTHRFHSIQEICSGLRTAGFDIEGIEERETPGRGLIWVLAERPGRKGRQTHIGERR